MVDTWGTYKFYEVEHTVQYYDIRPFTGAGNVSVDEECISLIKPSMRPGTPTLSAIITVLCSGSPKGSNPPLTLSWQLFLQSLSYEYSWAAVTVIIGRSIHGWVYEGTAHKDCHSSSKGLPELRSIMSVRRTREKESYDYIRVYYMIK